MRNVMVMIVTAAALGVGAFLLGYTYSEYIEEKPPVRISGWTWRIEIYSEDGSRTDFDYREAIREGELRCPRKAEDQLLPEGWQNWPVVLAIWAEHMDNLYPARTRELTPYDIRTPAHVSMRHRLRVEAGALDWNWNPPLPEFIRPALCVIELPNTSGGAPHRMFRATSAAEAERMARWLIWNEGKAGLEGAVKRHQEHSVLPL